MLKVLVAEDDLLLADALEEALVAAGYHVCGIAGTEAEALDLAYAHRPDLAVLDVRLARDGLGTTAGAALHAIGRIGILYATGSPDSAALRSARGVGSIGKPYRLADMLAALLLVREVMATGAATPPFPRNFRLLDGVAAHLAPSP